RDYDPLARNELSVWDAAHPAPKFDDPGFERALLKWFTDDAENQLRASAKSPDGLRRDVGGGVEVLIGRNFADPAVGEWDLKGKYARGGYVEMTGRLRNKTHGEELPVAWLYPKQWNGRVVVWLDDSGKAALFNTDGSARGVLRQLVKDGATVLGADLL